MSRITVRVEVPQIRKAYEVAIDTEANPSAVAEGLAKRWNVPGTRHYFRLRETFEIADQTTLELVGEAVDPFDVIGEVPI